MRKALNENIKALRQQRGLSQVDFAKRLCVTKQCVSNWENDNVLPSIEMLEKIADFFGVTTDFLLGRSASCPIDGEGLTEEQVLHIRLLVEDLKKVNK
ncbi:MAG: helix-turn-helix transcriptional regulator [Clostridia bacterium]|nr:helix-turn-helix transcriptional regulator [Clostridia bacterium]